MERVGIASLPSETLAARQRLCQRERNKNRYACNIESVCIVISSPCHGNVVGRIRPTGGNNCLLVANNAKIAGRICHAGYDIDDVLKLLGAVKGENAVGEGQASDHSKCSSDH